MIQSKTHPNLASNFSHFFLQVKQKNYWILVDLKDSNKNYRIYSNFFTIHNIRQYFAVLCPDLLWLGPPVSRPTVARTSLSALGSYYSPLESQKHLIDLSMIIVWWLISVGALDFEYACSPCQLNGNNFFEHTCAYARWALMHRFLSVRPSVCLSLDTNSGD